jgi:hypothetical protein
MRASGATCWATSWVLLKELADPLAHLAVDRVVVLAAQPVVVDPGRVRMARVDLVDRPAAGVDRGRVAHGLLSRARLASRAGTVMVGGLEPSQVLLHKRRSNRAHGRLRLRQTVTAALGAPAASVLQAGMSVSCRGVDRSQEEIVTKLDRHATSATQH